MSVRMKVLLAGLLISCQAMASFTLNGTRFIYGGGKKNISFVVTNHATDTWGGQVWIDNVSMPEESVSLIPAPTFFKVNGNQKQVVRILDVNDALMPKDRESLYFLNVQEIPPAPKSGGNTLSLAMNTQVKLIYRPESLAAGRADAEKNLRLETKDGGSVLVNPTPYYFAVVALHSGGAKQKLRMSSEATKKLGTLVPFSEVSLNQTVKTPLMVDAINDYGAVRTYTIN